MKVVFMGTPDFAVPTLQGIIDTGHEVIGVVTQPDKAKGRGKSVQFPAVKERALQHHIPVWQPPKVRTPEFINELKDMAPEVIVVVAFGQILPEEILTMPKYGCINVHASLLPKYRGAAPIQWAIIRGERITGVTTMYMDTGLDTGDMILKAQINIEEEETGGSLHDKLSVLGADLLIETLKKLEDQTAIRIPQDDSQSGEYAQMLKKSMGKIDFSQSAISIERLIRGLNPWPSAYTTLNGKTLKIWKAKVILKHYEGSYGEIVDITKDTIIVKASDGCLAIGALQMEGKKYMETNAFLRGNNIQKGLILE